ncbi:uncharacterized protein LOC119766020 [Culex quinquefasciatus]|uniref:uncharacterized protein LOC119766020 n=1 Tax=Culex quinquefasciatus TaxID=7176 RepID=UPI0018E3D044|nr:uncharacterized protein LOC119766020 [Culex quinquefasciatus]
MALPKRCVNNEIALKKINFRFLDKYEKVYFHGEEKDPTKRRTTKSYIIGGGQHRCCTRCRRFTTPQLPTYKHSPRDGLINSMFRMRFQDRELPVQALYFPAGKRRPPFPNQRPTPPRLS